MSIGSVRRLIRKNFGSYKNFILWLAFVSSAVFFIDSFLLPHSHRTTNRTVDRFESRQNQDGYIISNEQEHQRDAAEDTFEEPQPADNSEHKQNIEESNVIKANQRKADDGIWKDMEGEPANCGVTERCPKGSYPYLLRSGYLRNYSATICFNGDYLISASLQNHHRGLNVVIINENSLLIDDIQVFDVYFTDIGLLDYMKDNMREDQIVLIATEDEASYSLKAGGRNALKELGSLIVEDVGFRDNYVIAGKRGLPSGRALEKMAVRKTGKEFAEPVEISGCLAIPFEMNKPFPRQHKNSTTKDQKVKNSLPTDQKSNRVDGKGLNDSLHHQNVHQKANPVFGSKMGNDMENCGLKTPCAHDEISVHLYSGKQNKDPPKMCIDGKYIFAADLNGAGRGFNFAVVDPNSREVLRVSNFDTFASDNIAIEMFLEMLNEHELVFAIAYDEASEKLDQAIREAIEALGSSFIRMLSFRDVWVFIGQKGIRGYSPFEQISFSEASKSLLAWPEPIDLKTCVPLKFKALEKRQGLKRNFKRRLFCKTHDGFGQFCNANVVDKFFVPPSLTDTAVQKHVIYQTPIILVAGLNHNAVSLQLEALFQNAGLQHQVIRLFYDEKFSESKALAEVFDITSIGLPSSVKYADLLQKAIAKAWELFPHSNYLIVLEEEVLPAPDFLNFLRQMYSSLDADKTLIGVSAWNPNGFPETSSDVRVAYRAELFPGLGFMFKRSFYNQHMMNNMAECCSARSWEGWLKGKLVGLEMIIPEVSRVSRGRFDGQANELVKVMLRQNRLTSGTKQHVISTPDMYIEDKYVSHLLSLLNWSLSLNNRGIDLCLKNKTFRFNESNIISGDSRAVYVVYFEDKDNKVITRLCQCFQLSGCVAMPGYAFHRKLLRFSRGGKTVLLISSTSAYYKHKPQSVKPLLPSDISS